MNSNVSSKNILKNYTKHKKLTEIIVVIIVGICVAGILTWLFAVPHYKNCNEDPSCKFHFKGTFKRRSQCKDSCLKDDKQKSNEQFTQDISSTTSNINSNCGFMKQQFEPLAYKNGNTIQQKCFGNSINEFNNTILFYPSNNGNCKLNYGFDVTTGNPKLCAASSFTLGANTNGKYIPIGTQDVNSSFTLNESQIESINKLGLNEDEPITSEQCESIGKIINEEVFYCDDANCNSSSGTAQYKNNNGFCEICPENYYCNGQVQVSCPISYKPTQKIDIFSDGGFDLNQINIGDQVSQKINNETTVTGTVKEKTDKGDYNLLVQVNGFIPFVGDNPSIPNVVTINGKSYDLTGALGLSTETSPRGSNSISDCSFTGNIPPGGKPNENVEDASLGYFCNLSNENQIDNMQVVYDDNGIFRCTKPINLSDDNLDETCKFSSGNFISNPYYLPNRNDDNKMTSCQLASCSVNGGTSHCENYPACIGPNQCKHCDIGQMLSIDNKCVNCYDICKSNVGKGLIPGITEQDCAPDICGGGFYNDDPENNSVCKCCPAQSSNGNYSFVNSATGVCETEGGSCGPDKNNTSGRAFEYGGGFPCNGSKAACCSRSCINNGCPPGQGKNDSTNCEESCAPCQPEYYKNDDSAGPCLPVPSNACGINKIISGTTVSTGVGNYTLVQSYSPYKLENGQQCMGNDKWGYPCDFCYAQNNTCARNEECDTGIGGTNCPFGAIPQCTDDIIANKQCCFKFWSPPPGFIISSVFDPNENPPYEASFKPTGYVDTGYWQKCSGNFDVAILFSADPNQAS